MDTLIEMARDMGCTIQQDDRYIRTQMAQAAADEDAALQEMIGQFNLKRMTVGQLTAQLTEEKDDAVRKQTEARLKQMNDELQGLYETIMENQHMAAYNQARTELDKLMRQILNILTMSAQGADPDTVEAGDGCTGDCGSCGGCH